MSGARAEEVRRFFRQLAAQFSDCAAYRFELVAADVSGDLAYTVGYEHTSVSIDGTPVAPYTPARHSPLPPRGRRLEGSSTAMATLPRLTRPWLGR